MVSTGFILASLLSAPVKLDIASFAKAVSERTKTPALICSPDWVQVQGDVSDTVLDTFLEPSRREGFSYLRSDVAVGSMNGIPKSKWGVLSSYLGSGATSSGGKQMLIPSSACKDSKVSFETKANEFVSVQAISELKLSKPILVDAYFINSAQTFPIAFVGKDVAETDFLRAVAKGIGGQFRNTPKTFNIVFDPMVFRRESIKLVGKAEEGAGGGKPGSQPRTNGQEFLSGGGGYYAPTLATNKESSKAALTLLKAVISQMPDNLVEQTFGYSNTTTRLSLSVFKNLQASVVAYIQSQDKPTSTTAGATVQRENRATAAMRGLLNRVDPRNPGTVVITTDFRLSLELNTSNSANAVNLQVL